MNLYRDKALESRAQGFTNTIDIRGNLPISLTLLGILALVIGFVVFSLSTTYIRRVQVVGFVEPSAGSVQMTSPVSGRLALDVANGDTVAAGQRLAAISTGELSASGRSSVEDQIAALQRQIDINAAGLELVEQQLVASRKEGEGAKRLQVKKLEMARVELELAKADLEMAETDRDRVENLRKRNLSTASEFAGTRRSALSARRQLLNAEQTLAVAEDEGVQLALEYKARELELRQTVISMEREREELSAEIERLRTGREAGIFSPIHGRVTLSQAQDLENVTAGQLLFKIEPVDGDLIGVLLAPSSAIGFVSPGDSVQIRYRAFPYREHGVFTGDVFEIDSTAQLPQDLNAPVQVDEPVYRVKVRLDQAPRNKAGQQLRLGSGMLFDASVVIDEKRLLFWILDPVL